MSDSLPSPHVSRGRSFPLVWLVPIVALIAGAWMLFDEYRHRGPEITIEFKDGAGVEAGKTRIEFKGVGVGSVREVSLKPDLSAVLVRARLNRGASELATEGARFWIVQPEISFGAVRGLDTILTGARINVIPGKGEAADHFVGLERPPLPPGSEHSRTFVLLSTRLGSLNTGAPVFYREVKVGVVEDSRLADDSASVRIRVRIDAPYTALIRTNTRFWNTGGLSLKVGLFGAEMRNTSLESLVNGGVAFATPDALPLAAPAPAEMEFDLADEPEKSWLKWSPRIPINPPSAPPVERSPAGTLAPLMSSDGEDRNDNEITNDSADTDAGGERSRALQITS